MVVAAPEPEAEVEAPAGEKRVTLRGLCWDDYPHIKKGSDPDNAYYIQNQLLVKGRNVDFAVDPPPDLVVEVDITHTNILKISGDYSLGQTSVALIKALS